MSQTPPVVEPRRDALAVPAYHGLRTSADGYFALPDDGTRYQLIDGVMIMAPSALSDHQAAVAERMTQLMNHLHLDTQTKRDDYAAIGVEEHCLFDPEAKAQRSSPGCAWR